MTAGIGKTLAIGFLVTTSALAPFAAHAATVTYDLVRTSPLTNVDDPQGRWQFDGGKVYVGDTHVGYFVRKKGYSFVSPVTVSNAEVETTIIWKWGDYSFTAEGTHSFSTGFQAGGIRSTSAGFTAYENAQYSGDQNAITLSY